MLLPRPRGYSFLSKRLRGAKRGLPADAAGEAEGHKGARAREAPGCLLGPPPRRGRCEVCSASARPGGVRRELAAPASAASLSAHPLRALGVCASLQSLLTENSGHVACLRKGSSEEQMRTACGAASRAPGTAQKPSRKVRALALTPPSLLCSGAELLPSQGGLGW